jgi:hypothetical protein
MVTVSIHQPNYLPYLGFFDKMRKSDIFVIYDDSQFNSRDFHHRNKIRTSEGWKWLTIPVVEEKTSISNIKIKKINNWENKHFTAIRANYLKSKYFSEYSEAFEKIYSDKYEYLIDFNLRVIQFIKECFEIKTKIVYSSEFLLNSKSTEKLIDIVKACGGDTYLSGSGGHNYINESLFEQADIKLEFQEFEHPVYSQRYPGFVPNLSAIDFLFNEGARNFN